MGGSEETELSSDSSVRPEVQNQDVSSGLCSLLKLRRGGSSLPLRAAGGWLATPTVLGL